MAVIAAHQPQEELAELCRLVGSQNGAARVLGRPKALVSRWRQQPDRLRPQSIRLISDTWAVTRKAAEVFGLGTQLEAVLLAPRPEFGYERPAELIQSGRTDELLARLSELAGETEAIAIAAPEWKQQLDRELEESIAARVDGGGRLHESFVFLLGFDAEEAEAFAAEARAALAEAANEDQFDAFLAPQWERYEPTARPEPAVATLDPDEEPAEDEFNIDDLLLVSGGMASRRFREL
jgi:uncharacterized protein (DUF2384 family)